MLYNPLWKKEPGVVSLDDFIGWLETQNPAQHYDFRDNCGNCLVGQYMKARGIKWLLAYGNDNTYSKTCHTLFGDDRLHVGFHYKGTGEGDVLYAQPWTFGAALSRARTFRHNHS